MNSLQREENGFKQKEEECILSKDLTHIEL